MTTALPTKPSGGEAGGIPWYFSATSLVVAFFCVGPFMLPLIWMHPTMTLKKKGAYSAVIAGISLFLLFATLRALSALREYYKLLGL